MKLLLLKMKIGFGDISFFTVKKRKFLLIIASFKTGNQSIKQFLHLNNFRNEGGWFYRSFYNNGGNQFVSLIRTLNE